MPKLVDYAARFAFLREAAFQVVLDEGVEGLNASTVGQQLGVSASTVRRLVAADLPFVRLAAEEVVRRRRLDRRRSMRASDESSPAVALVRSTVPGTPARLAEELVWLRVTTASTLTGRWSSGDRDEAGCSVVAESPALVGDPQEESLPLRARFQIAERGYAVEAYPDQTAAEPVSDDASRVLGDLISDHAEDLTATMSRVVDLLEVPVGQRQHEVGILCALVTGLTHEICMLGRPPADAVTLLTEHLTTVSPSDSALGEECDEGLGHLPWEADGPATAAG